MTDMKVCHVLYVIQERDSFRAQHGGAAGHLLLPLLHSLWSALCELFINTPAISHQTSCLRITSSPPSYLEGRQSSLTQLHPLRHLSSPAWPPWTPRPQSNLTLNGLKTTSNPRTVKLLQHTSTRRACCRIFKDKRSPTTVGVPSCEWKTLIHCLTGTEKGDHFSESGADFFFFF